MNRYTSVAEYYDYENQRLEMLQREMLGDKATKRSPQNVSFPDAQMIQERHDVSGHGSHAGEVGCGQRGIGIDGETV